MLSTWKVLPRSLSKWVKDIVKSVFKFNLRLWSIQLHWKPVRGDRNTGFFFVFVVSRILGLSWKMLRNERLPHLHLSPQPHLWSLFSPLFSFLDYHLGTLSLLRCLADYYHSICLFYWALRCWIEHYRCISTSILETSVGWSCVSAPTGAWQIPQGDCQ